MILTQKQAQQIVRQGRNKDRIINILQEVGFEVLDDTDRTFPQTPRLTVINSNGTETCIYKEQPRSDYTIRVCKPGEGYPLTGAALLRRIAEMF